MSLTKKKNLTGAEKSDGMLLVSVIIPHFNDLENLRYCLRLLSKQTLSAERFEVIVADNNSTCGLAQMEKTCADRATLVRAPIQGAGAARNAGVAASKGHYLAFIDSDCCPAEDWLERGVAALARGDMVGGKVSLSVKNENQLTGVEAFERIFAFNFERYVQELGFAGSGNMFVPREIFDR